MVDTIPVILSSIGLQIIGELRKEGDRYRLYHYAVGEVHNDWYSSWNPFLDEMRRTEERTTLEREAEIFKTLYSDTPPVGAYICWGSNDTIEEGYCAWVDEATLVSTDILVTQEEVESCKYQDIDFRIDETGTPRNCFMVGVVDDYMTTEEKSRTYNWEDMPGLFNCWTQDQ